MKPHNKILVLDPAGNMWGSERVLLDFLGSESVQKRDVCLCCPPDTPLAQAAEKLGITVYPFFEAMLHKKGKLARLRAALGLIKACRRHHADIIYVNQAGASRIALLAGKLHGIPVVPHVRLLEDVRYIESLNASSKAMPKILVISEFIAEAFEKAVIRQRVITLYDAYKMTSDLNIENHLAPISTEFCCAGRLVPVKGQDVLIQAMAVLAENDIRVSLNLYGEGLFSENYEVDLNRLVEKHNLKSQVSFRGFINNIPIEMRRHRAAICSSYIEPLGRVVFEAWDSSTLPIVGRFSGGAAEVVIASGGGLLYDEQTPESLAKTMMECLALSPNEREEMVAKGRKWLKANCNAEEYSRKLLKILDLGNG